MCACVCLAGELRELSEGEEEKPNQGYIVDLVSRLLEASGMCIRLRPATLVPWPWAALTIPNCPLPLERACLLVGQAVHVTRIMVSEKPWDRRGGESLQGVGRPSCGQRGS